MQGFDGEEGIVVSLRLGIVALLLVDVSPEEERREVPFVSTQDPAVLREGLVPLLQIDVRLGLQQPEVNIIRMLPQFAIKDFNRVAPLLTRLCFCTNDRRQQRYQD